MHTALHYTFSGLNTVSIVYIMLPFPPYHLGKLLYQLWTWSVFVGCNSTFNVDWTRESVSFNTSHMRLMNFTASRWEVFLHVIIVHINQWDMRFNKGMDYILMQLHNYISLRSSLVNMHYTKKCTFSFIKLGTVGLQWQCSMLQQDNGYISLITTDFSEKIKQSFT